MDRIADSQNPTLGSLLHARALSSSRRRLVLDLGVGAAVSAIALWVRPGGWVALVCGGVCLAMYGGWAIAEGHLEALPSELPRLPRFVWQTVRGTSASCGIVAAFMLMFALIATALGTWIS